MIQTEELGKGSHVEAKSNFDQSVARVSKAKALKDWIASIQLITGAAYDLYSFSSVAIAELPSPLL